MTCPDLHGWCNLAEWRPLKREKMRRPNLAKKLKVLFCFLPNSTFKVGVKLLLPFDWRIVIDEGERSELQELGERNAENTYEMKFEIK